MMKNKIPYYERHLKETIPYDPQKQYAVIRASICTGEKVAGFKDINTGKFRDVMLISDSKDLEEFMKKFRISEEEIKREW